MMTRTCIPQSKARYSAQVRARRGVAIRSTAGSFGKVGEEHRAFDGARAAEFLRKVLRFLEGDADGGEDDGELALARAHFCLAGDLRGELRVREAAHAEHGQLLPRTRVLRPSIAEMPVWMNSLG